MEEGFLEKKYDGIYSNFEDGKPEEIVTKIPTRKGTALELGAGQGRNAIWLAKNGYSVEAVDISSVGVDLIN